jgi:hypothetical protein
MLLTVHIAAGALAIVFGAVALLVRKGGIVHRRGGMVFVYAMLVMGMTGSILGFMKSATDTNVLAGILTAYCVGTAVITVRPATAWTRRINIAAFVVAVALGLTYAALGMKALSTPRRSLNGVPFAMYFLFAIVLLLAATGDARIIRSGVLRGAPRLARHLWRMCFSLFIAAGSFFSIRQRVAKVLPEPFTTAPMRMLPILLVFVAMFYWLWRMRRKVPARILANTTEAALGPAAAPIAK